MKIILFRGRPGTGKTTLSRSLAKQIGSVVLRKDDIYDVTAKFVNEHNIRNKISYSVLYKILGSNVANNATVILDYPFQHSGDLEIIKKWCANNGAILKSILVTCSDEKVWTQRFEERSKDPKPNQLITDFESFKKLYGTMHLVPEKDELLVDTVDSIENILTSVTAFISK